MHSGLSLPMRILSVVQEAATHFCAYITWSLGDWCCIMCDTVYSVSGPAIDSLCEVVSEKRVETVSLLQVFYCSLAACYCAVPVLGYMHVLGRVCVSLSIA